MDRPRSPSRRSPGRMARITSPRPSRGIVAAARGLSRRPISPRAWSGADERPSCPPATCWPATELGGAWRTRRAAVEALLAGRPATGGPSRSTWPTGRPGTSASSGRSRRSAWGETASYGEIARRVGAPRAARAVGGAVGRNPVSLIVPCHRVIAADGTLGGYGGDGPFERRRAAPPQARAAPARGRHGRRTRPARLGPPVVRGGARAGDRWGRGVGRASLEDDDRRGRAAPPSMFAVFRDATSRCSGWPSSSRPPARR